MISDKLFSIISLKQQPPQLQNKKKHPLISIKYLGPKNIYFYN